MLPSTFMVPFSSIRVKKNEQNLIGAAPSIVPLAKLEKVVFVRPWAKEMCPQFSGIENELASEAARDFLLELREARMRRMLY